MLMQRKSAAESNAQVRNWSAEFNTSAVNIHEFWKMLQVDNSFSSNSYDFCLVFIHLKLVRGHPGFDIGYTLNHGLIVNQSG